jgi:hypothetical protein
LGKIKIPKVPLPVALKYLIKFDDIVGKGQIEYGILCYDSLSDSQTGVWESERLKISR